MTEFMGKFYLIPENKESKDKTTVYLNFGWNGKGNQSFPLYSKMVLENVCTESQYKNLCDDILCYLSRNGVNYCFSMTMMACCCFIVPMVILYCYVEGINRDVNEIVEKHTKHWSNCTVTMKMMQEGYRVTNLHSGVGYLEDGAILTRPEMLSRGSGFVPSGRREASWPPLGYNIILKFNGNTLRQKWPRLAIGQIPVQSHVMDREIGISEELEKLSKLKTEGLLTEEEYFAAKAMVLNPAH